MRSETILINGVALLRLTGTIGQEENILRETILEMLRKGITRIVLEMGGIPIMGSSALAELVSSLVSAQRYKAVVKLANPTTNVRGVLDITKLSTVFEIYNSEEEALRSF